MEHFVTLDRRPEDFRVPDDLADRFRYDGDRQRLTFRGFMSKGEFDRLTRVSHDWNYRRALDDLFRLCVDEDDEPPRAGVGGRLRALMGSLGLL